jgi:hypothetical protein
MKANKQLPRVFAATILYKWRALGRVDRLRAASLRWTERAPEIAQAALALATAHTCQLNGSHNTARAMESLAADSLREFAWRGRVEHV